MVLEFGLLNSGLFPTSEASGEGMGADKESTIIWTDVGVGIVPIGGIVAWLKDYAGKCPPLIPQYVECNGQAISDPASPLNGEDAPNLNGFGATTKRFLRGSTTCGTTGGTETHNHGSDTCAIGGKTIGDNNSASTLPSYYEVVWVMRIK